MQYTLPILAPYYYNTISGCVNNDSKLDSVNISINPEEQLVTISPGGSHGLEIIKYDSDNPYLTRVDYNLKCPIFIDAGGNVMIEQAFSKVEVENYGLLLAEVCDYIDFSYGEILSGEIEGGIEGCYAHYSVPNNRDSIRSEMTHLPKNEGNQLVFFNHSSSMWISTLTINSNIVRFVVACLTGHIIDSFAGSGPCAASSHTYRYSVKNENGIHELELIWGENRELERQVNFFLQPGTPWTAKIKEGKVVGASSKYHIACIQ